MYLVSSFHSLLALCSQEDKYWWSMDARASRGFLSEGKPAATITKSPAQFGTLDVRLGPYVSRGFRDSWAPPHESFGNEDL